MDDLPATAAYDSDGRLKRIEVHGVTLRRYDQGGYYTSCDDAYTLKQRAEKAEAQLAEARAKVEMLTKKAENLEYTRDQLLRILKEHPGSLHPPEAWPAPPAEEGT